MLSCTPVFNGDYQLALPQSKLRVTSYPNYISHYFYGIVHIFLSFHFLFQHFMPHIPSVMTRPASFLAASPHPTTTARSRRRSADDRLIHNDATTRKTAALTLLFPGGTWDQAIVITSDDENDGVGGSKATTDKEKTSQIEPRTPRKAGETLSVRSRSEAQLLHPPSTPADSRPPMPRMAQTDPEVERLSRRVDAASDLSPARGNFRTPCGKPYVRRGNYNNHIARCSKCTSLQSGDQHTARPAATMPLEASEVQSEETRPDRPSLSQAPQNKNEETRVAQSPPRVAAVSTQSDKRVAMPTQISAKDLNADLLDKVCARLTTQPDRAHVYLFRSAKLPGLVKVGIAGSISKRKAKLKSDCEQEMITIDIWQNKQNARHIEALVKLDLKHLKEPWPCKGKKCGSEHREWFRIDKERAVHIVQMWVDWLDHNPYDKDRNIKPIWEHLLNGGGRPAVRFGNEDHEARHTHWRSILRQPTQDEIDKFRLSQAEGSEKLQPNNQQHATRADSPQRVAMPGTPIQTPHTILPTTA